MVDHAGLGVSLSVVPCNLSVVSLSIADMIQSTHLSYEVQQVGHLDAGLTNAHLPSPCLPCQERHPH